MSSSKLDFPTTTSMNLVPQNKNTKKLKICILTVQCVKKYNTSMARSTEKQTQALKKRKHNGHLLLSCPIYVSLDHRPIFFLHKKEKKRKRNRNRRMD